MPTIKVRKYNDSIYIIYTHKTKIFKIFTGVKVEDKFWSLTAPRKNCPDYDNVITQITAMESRVLNASMKVRSMGFDPTIERVRTEFYAHIAPAQVTQPFWEAYSQYLSLLTCKESSKRKICMTKRVFEYFCTWSGYKFEIETFDRMTFGRFIQYMLINQHMADTTINKHVKILKTFLRFKYPLKDLTWMKYGLLVVDAEVVALTEGELQNLIDSELGGYLEKTRDLFIFLATTGMRYCDSQVFDPSCIM